jgi:hypothetical protein
MPYEEEDTCVPYEKEDTCVDRCDFGINGVLDGVIDAV